MINRIWLSPLGTDEPPPPRALPRHAAPWRLSATVRHIAQLLAALTRRP
jgi:hypothetical protein